MAKVVFLSTGIVYDTDQQMAKPNQVVERFVMGDPIKEKCVVTEVRYDERTGYSYSLLGLKSLRTFTTRCVFDDKTCTSGVCADLEYPAFLTAEQVAAIMVKATRSEQERQEEAIRTGQCLGRNARIVDYSERALAIFTDDPADTAVLERINAKPNSSLTYNGKKTAGWVFPKCRRSQLEAVMTN